MKKGILLFTMLVFAVLSAYGQTNPQMGNGLPFGTGPIPPVQEGETVKIPIQFFPPAPIDSQLSQIKFSMRWNPSSGLGFLDNEMATYLDTVQTSMRGWTFMFDTVSINQKRINFTLTAPEGVFYVKDDKPAKLFDLMMKVEQDNNHDLIRLIADSVFFTIKGEAKLINTQPVELGVINDKDGNNEPNGPSSMLPLTLPPNLQGEPNSKLKVPFNLFGQYAADSNFTGFRLEFDWMPRSSMQIENMIDTNQTYFKGWSFNFSRDTSYVSVDITAPNGVFLVKNDTMPKMAFALHVDLGSHETIKVIDLIAKSFIIKKESGNRELVGTMPKPLGKINLGNSGGGGGTGGESGNPYGSFVPLLASDTGRVNNGLYGGSVLDFAWDDVEHVMYAATEAASSIYASSDSGKTWTSPFPSDSLEWFVENQKRGWGGRGVQVIASEGYVYSITNEQAGTLNSSQIKRPGGQFSTLLDGYIGRSAFPTSNNMNIRLNSIDAIGEHVVISGESVLFRSDDAGFTWGLIYVPNQTREADFKITQVGILESDTDHVIVLAEKLSGMIHSRLYKTTDGMTFTDISPIDTDTLNVDKFAIHPTKRDTIFVTTRKSDGKTDGIWRTTNGGTDWTRIQTINQGAEMFRNLPQLFVYQTNETPLLIVMSGAGDNQKSTDLGDSFQDIDAKNDPSSNVVTSNAVGQAHISNSEIFFGTGDTGPTRSSAGLDGVFTPVPDGIEGVNVWKIAQSPHVLDTLYLATSSGIAYTTAYTRTDISNREKWMAPYGKFPINPNNGGNTGFTAIQVYENDPLHVVAANGNGLFMSKTGGKTNETWTSTDFNSISGLDGQLIRDQGGRVSDIAFLNADTIYATVSVQRSLYGAILASFDGGTSWSALPDVDTKRSYNALKKAVQGTKTYFYAVTGGIYDSGVVDSGAVFRSIDHGKTWSFRGRMPDAEFNPLGFSMPANDVEIVPNSLDTLYFAAGTNLSNVVGVSYDGGLTINSVFGGYEGAFSSVAINKDNPDSVYFAVRRNIFLFDAKSNTTELLYRGFPGELTYDLLYDALTQASSGGFFNVKRPGKKSTTTIYDGVLSSKPREVELKQNYPNPFNPTTTIEFKLAESKVIRLEVFNAIGQKVATLVNNEWHTSGTHRVQFDATKLASGVYFYTLKTGKVTLTQKMLLIK